MIEIVFPISFVVLLIVVVGFKALNSLISPSVATETTTESSGKSSWWNKSSTQVVAEIRKTEKTNQIIGIIIIYCAKVTARIALILLGFANIAIYIPY